MMGVTIDNSIKYLTAMRKTCQADTEMLSIAIETMRKYQQIEQMVKQYKKFGNIDFSMQIISGVVEDGNDK